MIQARTRVESVIALVFAAALVPVVASGDDEQKSPAPLLEGMGDHHHEVSTKVAESQRYFDQGLVLSYAFNHAEAARSFREAIRLDPECAMNYWGLALVLGPNINAKMVDDAVPEAYEAAQKALSLSESNTTPKERAYIEALATRYVAEPVEDRTSLDLAYADAMRSVSSKFPDDLDAATLLAEALMDTTPWDYWQKNGKPRESTESILNILESVLKRNPDHAGANHLYIHAVEAVRPELGIDAADRLGSLVPGAGHLVHMPSHIYIRVGRYHDGSRANEEAIKADDEYATQCHAQGTYPLGYMPHNHHFLWATSTFEGRAGKALETAEALSAKINQQIMRAPGMGTLQHFYVTPLYAAVRFGQWQQILDADKPDDDLLYPTGVWHYASAIACCRTNQLDKAAEHLEQLEQLTANDELETVTVWDINNTRDLLTVALEVTRGELAAARGDFESATKHLQEAVRLEGELQYDEPPTWHHPVRQILGAIELQAGDSAAAEKTYREDLAKYPANGWSLYGLAQALRDQGRAAEADEIWTQYREAWKRADVQLNSSRM